MEVVRRHMMLAGRGVATLALALALSTCAIAGTIVVDAGGSGDFTTIQDGINAATAGDTVLVLPGTYHEHLLLDSEADGIALVSQAGPELTIVTGDNVGPHSVVRCQDVGSSTLVEGFTFREGFSSTLGGGISCEYLASPAIVGNIIEDCWARAYGGGIAVDRGSPTIERNVVTGNRCEDAGGLYLFGGDITVRDNRIERNTADGFGGMKSGGGLYVVDGTHLIEGNIIAQNSARFTGGAMIIETGSTVTLLSNTVSDNTSSMGMGGLFIRDASVDALHNTITGNSGFDIGAAVVVTSWSSRGACTFEDNVIFGNTSEDPGGAAVHVLRGQAPSFQRNFLQNPTQYEVKISEASSADTLDFTGNWWGVADSTSIAARIWDCWDDPELGPCVDFSDWCVDPSCSGQATSVPESPEATWGCIKSMFDE